MQSAVDRPLRPVAAGDPLRKRISVEADGRWNVTVTGAEPRGIGDPEVQATLVLLMWLASACSSSC